jgi:hypothetical protein
VTRGEDVDGETCRALLRFPGGHGFADRAGSR